MYGDSVVEKHDVLLHGIIIIYVCDYDVMTSDNKRENVDSELFLFYDAIDVCRKVEVVVVLERIVIHRFNSKCSHILKQTFFC